MATQTTGSTESVHEKYHVEHLEKHENTKVGQELGAGIGGILVQPSFGVLFDEINHLNYITGIVSIYHAGGVAGVIVASYFADAYGRKMTFLFNCVPATIGAVLMTAAVNLDMFFVGRLFSGFAAYGFIFCTVIYIMEMSPASSRGLLGISNGISLELGFILMGWQSYGLQDWAVVGNQWSWRIPCIQQLLPVISICAGYAFVPESPRWLASKGRDEDALQVLLAVHKSKKDPTSLLARSEYVQIVQQCKLDATLPTSWFSMFTIYKKRTWCAILIEFGYLLAVYMVFCCISEPPAYLIACEVFPLQVRGKGIAIAYGTLAITNTWVIEAAATMTKVMQGKAYLLFITLSCANIVLWIFLVPETANVPLEEMARLFGDSDQVAIKATDIHLDGPTDEKSVA
ncbi:hypothetical protein RQP46_009476 [Phenoliferia psychrophenolica]